MKGKIKIRLEDDAPEWIRAVLECGFADGRLMIAAMEQFAIDNPNMPEEGREAYATALSTAIGVGLVELCDQQTAATIAKTISGVVIAQLRQMQAGQTSGVLVVEAGGDVESIPGRKDFNS